MKSKKFLIFISVLIIISIAIIFVINREEKKEEPKGFLFEEVLEEINLALDGDVFTEILDMRISHYIPISKIDNLLLAINHSNENEYFLLGKNLDNEQRLQLESMYSNKGDDSSIFYSDDEYLYFIKSEQNLYMIEGIINSFIYNY